MLRIRLSNTNCIRTLLLVTASATPAATPPRSILWAAGALLVSGLFGMIAGFLALTAGVKQWLYEQARKGNLNSSDVKNHKKSPASDSSLHHTASTISNENAILGVLVLFILCWVAWSLYRGRYWARWASIALLVLPTFVIGSGGFGGVLLLGSDAPAAFRVMSFIASLALIAAVVLTNIRPSMAYLALTRPPRRSGGGGLFAPRAPRPTANDAGGSSSNKSRPAPRATKAATVRPASSAKTVQRKTRVDVTAAPAPNRPRGKSRRADVDKTN